MSSKRTCHDVVEEGVPHRHWRLREPEERRGWWSTERTSLKPEYTYVLREGHEANERVALGRELSICALVLSHSAFGAVKVGWIACRC